MAGEIGEKIERCLASHRIPFTVHQHDPIVTFDDAKATLPFDPAVMVKGLAFELPGGRTAIVALRATDRADYRKISDALGIRRADLRKANPKHLETELDMQSGGIAPVPVDGATVLIDHTVLTLETIICGSGRRDASLELTTEGLASLPIHDIGDYRKTPSQKDTPLLMRPER